MAKLDTSYLRIPLKNPILAASSGLTNSADKIKELEDAGVGGVVLKSIFEEQINNEVTNMMEKDSQNTGYPEAEYYIQNYVRDNSLTNHLQLLEKAKSAVKIPIIASINCVSAKEWTTLAKDFQEAGADGLELNIFYVPTNRNEGPHEIEQLYINVLEKVKKEVSIPVSVKFGLHHSNIIGMAGKMKASGAAGIVMFNRFYEPDIDLDKLELTSSEVFSSPSDIRHTLRWVGLVSAQVFDLDIAASTGIHDGKAVVKQILAGATVAQMCSSIYLKGPQVITTALDEITEFMKKWNFRDLEEFRGRMSYSQIQDPMVYERSQFMKYFSGKNNKLK